MRTYTNPVYAGSCPDPFVLKHGGVYWAYSTGFAADGRCFPILRSSDLVHWTMVGAAMSPLAGEHPCYWAPEAVHRDGRFWLYYSVGNEERMAIRVATSDSPAGPFEDRGRALTTEPFAIDPHVFRDRDGTWWLFYATDFLEHTHVGTGTVCDRLLDALTLEGRPRIVTRARFDWQVYDPVRKEKGGVRWHTVEGPFVLEHKGLYYQMFSGGNWKNVTYGVSYATSRTVGGDEEWEQLCDGERVLPVLRTVPGRVIGPGHNSVVRGPANRQLFCVYHRWTDDVRSLCIDRLDWTGDRLTVIGPTEEPQFVPERPLYVELPTRARPEPIDVRLDLDAPALLAELTFELPAGDASGALSLQLAGDGAPLWTWCVGADGNVEVEREPAGPHLAPGAHLLRIELDVDRIGASVDGVDWCWSGRIEGRADGLGLACDAPGIRLVSFELTPGFEDLFAGPGDVTTAGWETTGDWAASAGTLRADALERPCEAFKRLAFDSYELVVNARLVRHDLPGAAFGIYPAASAEDCGPLLLVSRGNGAWRLAVQRDDAIHAVPLPPEFDAGEWQQLRIRKGLGLLRVYSGGTRVLELPAPEGRTYCGLHVRAALAAFDMVRLTELRDRLAATRGAPGA